MRAGSTLGGYDPRKVRQYVSLLETETLIMTERLEQQRAVFAAREAELNEEVERLKRELAEQERMESNLKQWLERNR